MAGQGLAAHQTQSPPPGRLPATDGRERAADGPVAATQLGAARPPAGDEVESGAPGEGVGRGGVVAAAVAGSAAPGLPDAGQRLLHQRGGGRVPRGAVQGLPEPVIVIWDGGTMHKGGPIRELVEESQGRLDIEPLPAHAPMLMPVEYLWRWLKVRSSVQLRAAGCPPPQRGGHPRTGSDPGRPESACGNFFHASDLPLPRALLS